MEKDVKAKEKCANPACGGKAAAGRQYCENCELEWTLYRRDLRGDDREKEAPALESR